MKNLIFKIAVLTGTVAAFASCSDTWLMYDTSQKDKLYFKYENYPSLDQYLSTDFSFALLDESVKEVKKTVTVTLLGMPADRDRTFEVRAIHDTTSNYTTGGVQRELIDAVENEDYTIASPYWWYYSATQQWYQYTGEFRQDKYRKLLELYHGIAETNPTLYASMVEQYGVNIDNDYYTGLNGQQLRMSMGFMVNRQNPHKMAWLRYVLCPLFDYYSTNYPDLEYYTTGSVNVTTGGWRDPANNY